VYKHHRQFETDPALGHAYYHVCRIRRRGAGMISFSVAITVLVWLAVAGWFVVLYFDD
jgi:hypothetical protein